MAVGGATAIGPELLDVDGVGLEGDGLVEADGPVEAVGAVEVDGPPKDGFVADGVEEELLVSDDGWSDSAHLRKAAKPASWSVAFSMFSTT